MGYSMATFVKSKPALDKMIDFMERNFQPWTKIGKEKDWDALRGPTNDISYIHDKLVIGFDLGGWTEGEYNYAICICAWMALKIGRKISFAKYGSDKKLPYINYDGKEKWPVAVQGVDPITGDLKQHGVVVDQTGYKPVSRMEKLWKRPLSIFEKKLIGGLEKIRKDYDKIIKAELKRLDKLWQEENS